MKLYTKNAKQDKTAARDANRQYRRRKNLMGHKSSWGMVGGTLFVIAMQLEELIHIVKMFVEH